MDIDAAARHRSGLLAILLVAPPRLMNGASQAPLTNREDSTREKHTPNAHVSYEHAGLVEWGVLATRAKLLNMLATVPLQEKPSPPLLPQEVADEREEDLHRGALSCPGSSFSQGSHVAMWHNCT